MWDWTRDVPLHLCPRTLSSSRDARHVACRGKGAAARGKGRRQAAGGQTHLRLKSNHLRLERDDPLPRAKENVSSRGLRRHATEGRGGGEESRRTRGVGGQASARRSLAKSVARPRRPAQRASWSSPPPPGGERKKNQYELREGRTLSLSPQKTSPSAPLDLPTCEMVVRRLPSGETSWARARARSWPPADEGASPAMLSFLVLALRIYEDDEVGRGPLTPPLPLGGARKSN